MRSGEHRKFIKLRMVRQEQVDERQMAWQCRSPMDKGEAKLFLLMQTWGLGFGFISMRNERVNTWLSVWVMA
jgi:hypothetical protein